jgi:hypothetical protein
VQLIERHWFSSLWNVQTSFSLHPQSHCWISGSSQIVSLNDSASSPPPPCIIRNVRKPPSCSPSRSKKMDLYCFCPTLIVRTRECFQVVGTQYVRCAEPWVEAKFESPKQGAIQVIISPLVRLTNRPGASIESIGSADDIITSLGQFVTGRPFSKELFGWTSLLLLNPASIFSK